MTSELQRGLLKMNRRPSLEEPIVQLAVFPVAVLPQRPDVLEWLRFARRLRSMRR